MPAGCSILPDVALCANIDDTRVTVLGGEEGSFKGYYDLSVDARRELRARESMPVLDKIETYLRDLAPSALPKSSWGKAVTYARNQWQALRRYTEDGRLSIDNNVSERTLRHQAVGRKNWLFLGSEAAGPRAAVLYTILAGAKRHRIEPWAYIRDLLLRLGADDLRLEEMLPDRWAADHPEAILNHRLEESRTEAIRTRARRAHRRALRKCPWLLAANSTDKADAYRCAG